MLVVDHMKPVSIDATLAPNEILTLECLRLEIFALANQVALFEKPLQEQDDKMGVRRFIFRSSSENQRSDLKLIACYFHWFGNSMCNYARLIGYLDGLSLNPNFKNVTHDVLDRLRCHQRKWICA